MNTIKIFASLFFLQIVSTVYSQTGEAKSLELGNTWFYRDIIYWFEEDTLNYYQKIIGDTIFQDKQYAVILDNRMDTLYWFERADSSKIFSFNTNVMQEHVIVDFALPDTAWPNHIVTNDTIFFWDSFRVRQCLYVYGGIGEYNYCYVKGLGLVTHSFTGHYPDEYNQLVAGIIEGVFYGDSTVLHIEVFDNKSISNFSLSQNYPNPFNPITTIKYNLPGISFVTLKVYDVLGNEIASLVNEQKPAGSYEVEFDGTNLTSGIYFYQLRAGKYVETKKMVLLK